MTCRAELAAAEKLTGDVMPLGTQALIGHFVIAQHAGDHQIALDIQRHRWVVDGFGLGQRPLQRAGKVAIEVLDHATVRGVWADIKVEESDIVSKFRLNYTLEKENGAWRMTGSTLAG